MEKLYKIYKKINGKNVNIGNITAESPMRAKMKYAKAAGLSIQDYKRYTAKLFKGKKYWN